MNQKIILGFIIALLSLSIYVSALPVGPRSLINSSDERWPTWGAFNKSAIAGNVTQLIINGSTITKTYQGYYGNITGMIVLGDGNNNTLYDWTLSAPQGEIYAVRNYTLPEWGSVQCIDDQHVIDEDLRLGVNNTQDEDSVNRTFVVGGAADQLARFPDSDFNHTEFWVANQSIARSSCRVATLYNSTYQPALNFKEVLLQDSQDLVIYTAIISHTTNPFGDDLGFNGGNHDFEMLVGEDGHGIEDGGTATSTAYYFYVELS